MSTRSRARSKPPAAASSLTDGKQHEGAQESSSKSPDRDEPQVKTQRVASPRTKRVASPKRAAASPKTTPKRPTSPKPKRSSASPKPKRAATSPKRSISPRAERPASPKQVAQSTPSTPAYSDFPKLKSFRKRPRESSAVQQQVDTVPHELQQASRYAGAGSSSSLAEPPQQQDQETKSNKASKIKAKNAAHEAAEINKDKSSAGTKAPSQDVALAATADASPSRTTRSSPRRAPASRKEIKVEAPVVVQAPATVVPKKEAPKSPRGRQSSESVTPAITNSSQPKPGPLIQAKDSKSPRGRKRKTTDVATENDLGETVPVVKNSDKADDKAAVHVVSRQQVGTGAAPASKKAKQADTVIVAPASKPSVEADTVLASAAVKERAEVKKDKVKKTIKASLPSAPIPVDESTPSESKVKRKTKRVEPEKRQVHKVARAPLVESEPIVTVISGPVFCTKCQEPTEVMEAPAISASQGESASAATTSASASAFGLFRVCTGCFHRVQISVHEFGHVCLGRV